VEGGSVELPALRIPIGHEQRTGRVSTTPGCYHQAPPFPVKTEPPSTAMELSPHGPATRSPSSPSSFFVAAQPDAAKVCSCLPGVVHSNASRRRGGLDQPPVHVHPGQKMVVAPLPSLEVSPYGCYCVFCSSA
jgi:hypothetical protein